MVRAGSVTAAGAATRQRILSALAELSAADPAPVTIRALCAKAHVSIGSATWHLKRLEQEGIIDPRPAQGVRLKVAAP